MNKPTRELPQNLKDILKDIGENAVLFHIYNQLHHTDWQVYKNLEHSGCDLVLINTTKKNNVIKIEVKTRQSLYTTATSKNTLNQREFSVSKNEFQEMDILVCYWFDYNALFIVPKDKLKERVNSHKIKIRRNKDGGYGINNIYLNNWNNLNKLL